jgi:hypothetical protein
MIDGHWFVEIFEIGGQRIGNGRSIYRPCGLEVSALVLQFEIEVRSR